jgi:4-hydroxybenzoate polyprenyltransferase
MFKRIGIYIREMFPLKVYIPFAILNHYILFFAVQLFLGVEKPILSVYSLIGVVTIFGFMLIMRIFDELKDEVIDQKLFAHRPYPRGDVKKSDLLFLLFTTFIVVVALNSVKSYTLPFFLVCVGYGYLTFKWFFFRQAISTNLLLALATHQPLTILINVYVVSTAMVQTNQFAWSGLVIWSAIVFFLPVLAWEISRKIKSHGTENEYVTYSKIFGTRLAGFISLFVNLSFTFSLIYLGYKLRMNSWDLIIQLLIAAWMLLIYVKFLKNQINENHKLKKTAEVQSSIAILVFLVFLIIQHGIEFRWFIQ